MDLTSRFPPYTDMCDQCPELPYVQPIMTTLRRPDWLVADYLCPRGHTWWCSWQPRTNDYRRAA